MIYKNIDIHNVACLVESEDGGVSWLRFPQEVASEFEGGEGAYNVARYATGVELRFVIESGDSATITLRKREDDGITHTFRVNRGGVSKKDITFAETTDGDAIYEFVKLIRREGFNDYRFCSYLMI